jgi:hypothetical protein
MTQGSTTQVTLRVSAKEMRDFEEGLRASVSERANRDIYVRMRASLTGDSTMDIPKDPPE